MYSSASAGCVLVKTKVRWDHTVMGLRSIPEIGTWTLTSIWRHCSENREISQQTLQSSLYVSQSTCFLLNANLIFPIVYCSYTRRLEKIFIKPQWRKTKTASSVGSPRISTDQTYNNISQLETAYHNQTTESYRFNWNKCSMNVFIWMHSINRLDNRFIRKQKMRKRYNYWNIYINMVNMI
jgi:hypothetical protein